MFFWHPPLGGYLKGKPMSEWHEVKDPADVELSDDGQSVDILFDTDPNGNHYVTVPLDMLAQFFITAPDGCTCGGTARGELHYIWCKKIRPE